MPDRGRGRAPLQVGRHFSAAGGDPFPDGSRPKLLDRVRHTIRTRHYRRHPLQAHLGEVKRQHERDLATGVGRAVLPFALDRKYPNASTDWAWQFVFPAARICRDPRWGRPSRFHLHESGVQKEIVAAVGRAGLAKRVSPHVFRSVST